MTTYEKDEKDIIANNFNKYFTNIGPKLASKIPNSYRSIESYLIKTNFILTETDLTEKELESAFNSLRSGPTNLKVKNSESASKIVLEKVFCFEKKYIYITFVMF